MMEQYLRKAGVMWKDFKTFAITLTGRIRSFVRLNIRLEA
jgi:hypothetical protein